MTSLRTIERKLIPTALALLVLGLGTTACSGGPTPIRVGAVYPLSGSQAAGGVDEYRGVHLAVDMVNALGGVHGHPIELDTVDVSQADAAPQGVDMLAAKGIRFVIGSYGSTISQAAATEATRHGMVFWETGAVGWMRPSAPGRLFFRVAPSGSVLGHVAVSFVTDQLAPLLHASGTTLRFAVANVDDVYGRSVAAGAVQEIRSLGLSFAGQFSYDLASFDPHAVVARIAASHPDVLFVSAYVEDGVTLRRAMVTDGLHLLANIGTSSSYCMMPFGAALGEKAVGLFASDKPDANALNEQGLTAGARNLLDRARSAWRDRYHQDMDAPALAGFSAAWALFRDVMPAAGELTPSGVAAAALSVRIPSGGLPNGSGLQFGAPGSADAGANLRAASVIWEWVGVKQRAVVWPPQFATQPIQAMAIQP